MTTYQTESGYIAKETPSGIDIYECDGESFLCEVVGKNLDDYRDEYEDINDGALEADINETLNTEGCIACQQDYC